MLAVGAGHAAAVRALVASGADPRLEDYTGHDAFYLAMGRPAIVAALKSGRQRAR
jgi:ankyrin repeat protein